MMEPGEFYFSNPKTLKENEYIEVPLVMIVSKEEYDEKESINCLDEKYFDLLELVDFMVDLEENIFEPYDSEISAEGLKLKLLGMRFIYNPKLDSELEKWIKEKEIEARRRLLYQKVGKKQFKEKLKEDDFVDAD